MAPRITSTAIALCAASALLLPASAPAAPGDLDPTFSGDGFVTADLDDGVSSELNDILVQPDGRIVGIGGRVNEEFDPTVIDPPSSSVNSAVARYEADGSPDSSFGGDGVVASELVPEHPEFAGYEFAEAGALQPDGKIVIVAHAFTDYKVARLDPDGSLDASFAGDGRTTVPIGSDSARGTFVGDVEIANDGKIVVTGNAGKRAGIARLNPDGSLDRSFSSNGQAFVPHTYGFDAALDPKGRILVAGTRDNRPRGSKGQPAEGISITRLKRNGSIDRRFAGDGVVTALHGVPGITEANALAVQPNGKAVVAGYDHGDFVAARVTRRGRLDDSFSRNGRVITDLGLDESSGRPGGRDQPRDLVLGPNGTIYVAGLARASGDIGDAAAIVRYRKNGTLDRSFDGDGRRLLEIGTGADPCAAWNGIAVTGHDVVAAGEAECDINARRAAVARFQG